ncbi:hypothetical protein EHO59_15725 [Leptospira semungkisensis]|uniref:SURF1-like protein n=1 Tax=Leptospira semungkisensis TaxID=2484985 RepID=A0A4R9FL91_9LEPT|nr:SURF1 family cytochrome oxidase biogenesis protein [Leptospira semungkisensis]TGJ99317.1 hypothetical protein EHO59_15725 [Leptospira semungkisensis]
MNIKTKLRFAMPLVLLSTFSNSCETEKKMVYEPDSQIWKAYNNKNALSQTDKNPYAVLIGHFHPAEILIEATKFDHPGYLVIKPFSYVHKPNPSLGWPSWYAQKAILVNVGWISQENVQNHAYKFMRYEDALFMSPVIIYGFRRKITDLKMYDDTSIALKKKISYKILWKLMDEKIAELDLAPYGLEGLPIYFDLILGPPSPELWKENISVFSKE